MDGTKFRERYSTIHSLLTVESTLVNTANELFENGLIQDGTHTQVTTHLAQPTSTRASILMAAVKPFITVFPDKEQIVLQILDNNTKVFSFQAQINVETTHDETS